MSQENPSFNPEIPTEVTPEDRANIAILLLHGKSPEACAAFLIIDEAPKLIKWGENTVLAYKFPSYYILGTETANIQQVLAVPSTDLPSQVEEYYVRTKFAELINKGGAQKFIDSFTDAAIQSMHDPEGSGKVYKQALELQRQRFHQLYTAAQEAGLG